MWITAAIHSLQVIHPGLCEDQVSWISRAEPGEIPGWACRALCNPALTSGDSSQAACAQEPTTLSFVPGQQAQAGSRVPPQKPYGQQTDPKRPVNNAGRYRPRVTSSI